MGLTSMTKRQSKNMTYNFETKSPIVLKKNDDKNANTKKKGIIYARVSTEEQKRTGNGINWQIIDCEVRAKNNNVEIIGTFKDEAITWSNLARKWFIEAIKYIEEHNRKGVTIDYFICWSTSRFSRSPNLGETFNMVARVETAGARLVAVGNGWIQETDTEEGMLSIWLNFLVDAIESKRWQKRVKCGQKWKIYEGFRPFPDVPLGYQRIKEIINGKEIKILIKQEPEASILKEWLQLFAEWILLTKHDLFEFFNERWIRSNSKKNKSGKLHESIIDRLLDVWKLTVYTWYLTYPDRGINEFIPWKHPAIIDFDIMHKIMVRLKKDKDLTGHKQKAYDEDADEYPLKRILLCPECNRWVTKRKSKSKTGDYHHYYGCNNSSCILHKKALPREDVHEAVRKKLQNITPPPYASKLFEHIFKEERKKINHDEKGLQKDKEHKIKLLHDEMERIENAIDNITDTALFQKKQQRRSELNEEKTILQNEIEDVRFSEDDFEKVYNEAKVIISNPLAIRDLEDVEIKQLLIRVCFNNKIYYTKNQELHTPEISLIYSYFAQVSDSNSPNLETTDTILNILMEFVITSDFRFIKNIVQSYEYITWEQWYITSRLSKRQLTLYGFDN